jgi:hypothetical protein
MPKPTAAQLDRVLAILTNARDAALIGKVAIELGLEPHGDGLDFLKHLQMAAKAVGVDLLPAHLPTPFFQDEPDDYPNTMGHG